ncbi:unnamed protein product [Adineta ricciae]|uniref:Uncharacterized protein n=1 Tax=Adineta ricciae TaxID=249248 RepID=A0A816A5W7_ADIRI|nr:unnamed protein product [Adineta ricciae]CAF1591542.1 unnamed protein product [Adineta ricciae]
MDSATAQSYYTGYSSFDRFLTISFMHNYLLTWSFAFICSFILPILYLFAPGSLRTTRSTHFLLICIVALSYTFALYFQIYLVSFSGDLNLPYHACRFVIYISTFAKPMGLYLTLLFSFERVYTKILSKNYLRSKLNQRLFQKIYPLITLVVLILIFGKRLYDVFQILPHNRTTVFEQTIDISNNSSNDIPDVNDNSTDQNMTISCCFNTLNAQAYSKMLTFQISQYWFEYAIVGILFTMFITILIQQYSSRQGNSLYQFSVNTKFYLSLCSCVIGSEAVLFVVHFIIKKADNTNTESALISIQWMLFTFHLRSIFLPVIVCILTCNPLKEFLYELFITRPYTENVEETDTINERTDPFSSSQRPNGHLRDRFRRPFTSQPKRNETQDNL